MSYLRKIIFPALLIGIVITESCNKGIEPVYDSPGFSGRVTFKGTWPDSIKRTFIVVFDSLLEEPNDFTLYNLKFISGGIPTGVSYFDYNSRDSALVQIDPGTYAYVAVVQQKTETISLLRKDWIVAGIYYTNDDTTNPGRLIIPSDGFVRNINILCDFDNPPPQPPGG